MTKQEALKRIEESKKRVGKIRSGEVVPIAVRVADKGGGAYSIRVINVGTGKRLAL